MPKTFVSSDRTPRKHHLEKISAMERFSNILLSSLYLAAAISASYTPCDFCATRASTWELGNMSFRAYPEGTFSNYKSVLIANGSDLLDDFDLQKPSILYISGWTETPNSSSVLAVVGGYFERGDHNIFVLDYTKIAAKSYPVAAFSVEGVGYTVAGALDNMVLHGFDLSTLHIVGHSLGAQVAAYVGRYTKSKVPRITGLDPAGPAFDGIGQPLSHNDAKFVDVIHTDAGYYGSIKSIGHFNSCPNGGTRTQPGCLEFRTPFDDDDFCDHHKSWYYYAESLLREEAFIGAKCESWYSFKQGLCSSNEQVVVGYGTPTTAKGIVYFQTDESSPFGRGKKGLKYEASPFSITSWLTSLNFTFPFRR